MAMISSGKFTTSTPIPKQHDSGFYENSPQSRHLSPTSAGVNLEPSYLLLRKSLFGKRRSSENIPDQFLNKDKLLLSRSSTFSRRNASANKETPRTSRMCAGSDKPVYSEETKNLRRPPGWLLNCKMTPLKQLDDSGFCDKTPERSGSPKTECYETPLLPLIKKLHQSKESSKEESLAHFKNALKFSGAKSCADLSASEMRRLYSVYRFQRMGLKPSSADIAFYEKNLPMKEESEMLLLSWKDKLEHISANLDYPPEIDFLWQFYKMNAYSIVSNILSYLSGSDLINASCVNRLWRKLILENKGANKTRQAYLKEQQKIMKEMEKKKLNPFQRPPNFRILGSIENVMEQVQLKRTIKEINFDAFIEIGKSGKKHKPMKCPSCANLSLQNKKVITKYNCLFCGYAFCCNCFKPYSNWHYCGSTYSPAEKPCANGKKYLRRL